MKDHSYDDIAQSKHTAKVWIAAVADELGTEDRHYAWRVLRAWLHTVRDRIGVDAAAHFAAQLPIVLRGLFYEGWKPSQVPVKLDADQFVAHMAREARISSADVRPTVAAITAALQERCSPGQLDHLLAQLPGPLRDLLVPVEQPVARTKAGNGPPAAEPRDDDARMERVERSVEILGEALRALVRGLEEHPSEEVRPERAAAAAQRAHRVLLTLGQQ